MKAVIYARYSSDNQREESIDAQIRAIKEYAGTQDFSIVKIYIDEARSATTDDRPQFLNMIKDSDLHFFDTVIVHKLDRFARNRYDSAFYKKRLKDNGIRLVSVLEQLDDSPESIILESVLEGMAEYYSKNLAREVAKGMKETALECKHNGGVAPLGYTVGEDKRYAVNETESKIVKTIFTMYADGSSYNAIISKLNSDGSKTKLGNNFGKNSIHDILRNEKYLGIYIFNKSSKKKNGKRNSHEHKQEDDIIKIEGGMPRIITEDLWREVKVKMDMNKVNRAANAAKTIYLLSGLIFCGKCGNTMTGNKRYAGRNKTLYMTYECSARKRNHSCDAKAINKEFAENVVLNELSENLFSDKGIEKIIKKILEHASNQGKEILSDLKLYKKEMVEIQLKIDNMINAVANGFYNDSMKEKMSELENRKSTLAIRMEEAKREMSLNSPTEEMIRKYLKKDSDIKNKTLEEQKSIIQSYVSKVVVNENTIVTSTIVSFNGGGEGSRTPVRK